MLNTNYAKIGDTVVDVTTVMDKSVTYTPSKELVEEVMDEFYELMDKYFPGHLKTGNGVKRMFSKNGTFWKEKGWLIRLLEKMPGYNGRLQVIIPQTKCKKGIEYNNASDALWAMINWIDYNRSSDVAQFVRSILTRISEMLEEEYRNIIDYTDYNPETFESECRVVNNNLVAYIEDQKKYFYQNVKFSVAPGMKISRLVGKLCNLVNIKEWVKITDVSFIDNNGIPHTRTKDMGWNHNFSMFGDAITEVETVMPFVISAHPIDFLTMSFGYKWTSCHTIDIYGIRSNDAHGHGGMYCGGTMSYMLDNSSLITYYLKDLPQDGRPEFVDKMKRCVFYLGEDKIIQSRVYPDGRDSGDMSLSYSMRSVVQRCVANALDVPNYWMLEKGTHPCGQVTSSYGPHYQDYLSYEDCNVSYLRRFDSYKNKRIVHIGNDIICPECGINHLTDGNIFDYDCQISLKKCRGCGRLFQRDEMDVVNYSYYCCDCASEVSEGNAGESIDLSEDPDYISF